MISTLLTANHEANIAVPAEMLDSGSHVQVAEINVVRNGRTARFWVQVSLSHGSNSPKVTVIANSANSSKSQQVFGTYLDLAARRAEKGLPPLTPAA
jgi:hypothetical protein